MRNTLNMTSLDGALLRLMKELNDLRGKRDALDSQITELEGEVRERLRESLGVDAAGRILGGLIDRVGDAAGRVGSTVGDAAGRVGSTVADKVGEVTGHGGRND